MSLTSRSETADQLLALRHSHLLEIPETEAVIAQNQSATAATEDTTESLDDTDEGQTATETDAETTKATDLKEFLEYKNLSPVRLAQALFPLPVQCPHDWFVAEIAKKHAQAQKRENKKKAPDRQANNEPPTVPEYVLQTSWRGAAEEICNQFIKNYSLQCSFSCSDWVTTSFNQTKQGIQKFKKVYGQQWGENFKVPFFCSTCKAEGKYSLVALGVTTGCHKIVSSSTDSIPATHGVEVSQVYFHDSNCSGSSSSPSTLWYQTSKYCVVPFDFQAIIGHTYSKAVSKLQGFPVEPPYFDPQMSEEKRLLWTEKFGGSGRPWKDKATKAENHEGYPQPGALINFGDADYDHDDRMYCYVPSEEWEINGEEHKSSMLRWVYHLTAHFSLSKQMAPYVLDHPNIQQQMDNKGTNLTSYVPMVNPDCHLRPTEVSLLFGGHEQRVHGNDPIHQMRHRDGDTEKDPFGDNEALNNLFFPFSFIIPLEDKRDLYIGTPATTISTPKGFYIIFRGDVPHGGMTYRGTEWHPCVHGHMDSDFHTRASGLFNYCSEHDGYLPVEHMLLMHNTNNMCEHFLDIERQYKSLLKLVCNMTPWLTERMAEKDELAAKVNALLNQIGLSRYNFCKKKTRS